MNILVICDSNLYRDFSTSFVHAQAAAYAALGHRVRVIVPYAIGKRDWDKKRFSGPIHRWEQNGVEIYSMRHLAAGNHGVKHFNLASALRVLPGKLDKLLEGFAPDVIHAHALGFNTEIGAWLKNRLGVPLVATAHGGDVFAPYTAGELQQLKGYADHTDHLVCVSTLLQRRVESCNVSVPTSVILNGFRIGNASPDPNKSPLSLVQAGFLVARKKGDITIRAFSKLCEKHPGASLDIIGSGSELERFQTLCRDLGIADSVRFHGYLSNAKTLAEMAKARFFVMPSVNEGFGIVYLEAMASGCVTIGTEGEGIADLIVSGKNGFLVPPDNPEAIVSAIEWCLEHPEEADAVAEQGRKDALGLTWQKNAEQYIELFERMLGDERNH